MICNCRGRCGECVFVFPPTGGGEKTKEVEGGGGSYVFAYIFTPYFSQSSPAPLIHSNSDIFSNQGSKDEISSPSSGGGLTLEQQTKLLAILAGAAFQGGKQEEAAEAEARPA